MLFRPLTCRNKPEQVFYVTVRWLRPAPPFTLPPLGGGTAVSLDSLRGRPLVLNFWASWCVPCVHEHPTLLRAARQYGQEVRFLGILYEDTETDAQAFLAEHGVAFPSLVDPGGRTAIAYGLGGVPETYFIDAQGRVISKYVGPLDPATLSARLQELRPR